VTETAASTAPPALAFVNISKHYLGVEALSDVSLQLSSGEVLCVLGHNGAGKSTMVRLLSGVIMPTSGTINVNGVPVRLSEPRQAYTLGIATVHQDVGAIPLMSVARNFCLGSEPTKGWGPFRRMDMQTARKIALEEVHRLGIRGVHDPDQLVQTLSGGERQALAIARAVHYGARVLILDEPTSDLGVRESDIVLRLIGQVRDAGVAVIFVTHQAPHAMAVGDRFMVLIRGRCATTFERGERTRAQLLSLMSGGEEMEALEAEIERERAGAREAGG
jgi:simple sugar transport system ATP-binding protein